MQIYKDRACLSGYRLVVPADSGLPVSFIGEHLVPKNNSLAPHAHDTWELLLQTVGSSTWSQGNRLVKVREGDLLICPPGVLHGKDRRETVDFRILWVGCKMDPELWPLLKTLIPDRRMTTLPEAQETATVIRLLEGELMFEKPLQKEGVNLAWKKLWLTIYRLAQDRRRNWRREESPLVQRVRTLVEAQPGERWTLPMMGLRIGYAGNYFATLFKRESGESFHQYLMTARIAAAKRALAMGEESIIDVALKLGFSSTQHFSRVFAKKIGVPPTRWIAAERSRRAGEGGTR